MSNFPPRKNSYEETLSPELLGIIREYDFYASDDENEVEEQQPAPVAPKPQHKPQSAPPPVIPQQYRVNAAPSPSARAYADSPTEDFEPVYGDSQDSFEEYDSSTAKIKIAAVFCAVTLLTFCMIVTALLVKNASLKKENSKLLEDNSSYALMAKENKNSSKENKDPSEDEQQAESAADSSDDTSDSEESAADTETKPDSKADSSSSKKDSKTTSKDSKAGNDSKSKDQSSKKSSDSSSSKADSSSEADSSSQDDSSSEPDSSSQEDSSSETDSSSAESEDIDPDIAELRLDDTKIYDMELNDGYFILIKDVSEPEYNWKAYKGSEVINQYKYVANGEFLSPDNVQLDYSGKYTDDYGFSCYVFENTEGYTYIIKLTDGSDTNEW